MTDVRDDLSGLLRTALVEPAAVPQEAIARLLGAGGGESETGLPGPPAAGRARPAPGNPAHPHGVPAMDRNRPSGRRCGMNEDGRESEVPTGTARSSCPGGPDRSSGRLGVSLEARLRPCRRGSPGLGVRVTDVCLGGLRLEFAEEPPPEPGQVLVEICLPGLAECQVLPGRLSWLQREGDSWRAGVELLEDTAWAWFATLRGMVRALAEAPR